jgi:putative addiction module component (TIGR02574 family)
MTEAVKQFKAQLVQLSEDERAELAHFLLESLGPPNGENGELDDALKTELARRSEELASGRVQGIPAEEVLKELREQYP